MFVLFFKGKVGYCNKTNGCFYTQVTTEKYISNFIDVDHVFLFTELEGRFNVATKSIRNGQLSVTTG